MPPLIGPGDLVLDDSTVREALLSSGLVAGSQIQSSLREICTGDICDPDDPERGTARRHDIRRQIQPQSRMQNQANMTNGIGQAETSDSDGRADIDRGVNPRASERAATALFVYTISPRPQAARGATEAELLTATFVPDPDYTHGDAEAVWQELQNTTTGLAALDSKEGGGRRPKRWWLETRATLRMLHRRELEAVTDADRDKAVTDRAFADAVSGPFNSVRTVSGGTDSTRPTSGDLHGMIAAAGLDDGRSTRLVLLDSRWFSLLNGVDADTRNAVQAAFGISEETPAHFTVHRTSEAAHDLGVVMRVRSDQHADASTRPSARQQLPGSRTRRINGSWSRTMKKCAPKPKARDAKPRNASARTSNAPTSTFST